MPEDVTATVLNPEPTLLGPFLGHVTTDSIKIWLHLEREDTPQVHVTLHPRNFDAAAVASQTLNLAPENLFTDCVTLSGLESDMLYFYKLWTNPAHSLPLNLEGLARRELHFRTLSADPDEQIDFVVMSCHNPHEAKKDGHEGHAVWADLPQIIARDNNKRVRFAVLVGDQIYADAWEDRVRAEQSEGKRLRYYLSAYRQFWSNIHYRRVLCSLPSVMMWDDHDITDGWGSRVESFQGNTSEFRPEWKQLFEAASRAFSIMQASRNPEPLAAETKDGFDVCFTIGQWGFVLMDLRSKRNWMEHRLFGQDQFDRIQQWVEAHKETIHTLFVISPVVFSHGSPVIDDLIVRRWKWVLWAFERISKLGKWGRGLNARFDKQVGDIRDDIRDSWGCKENGPQTDLLLDFLFRLQNDSTHPIGVVILSGDIHTSGYANIYSSDEEHEERSSIPHITSSSVGYPPFSWILEAIYRYATKSVALGVRGVYSSQVSHHFTSRSVAVLSLRRAQGEGDYQLKVKYYLEGYPEPHVLLFDLSRRSHRENITWVAQDQVSAKKYAPTANRDLEAALLEVDIEAALAQRAQRSAAKLNWRDSIVDLMKLLGLDSSLGARKQLAEKWGFDGTLGTPEMNIWLHQRVVERLTDNQGNLPADLDSEPTATPEENASPQPPA